MKHRKLGLVAGLSLLGLLAVGCGAGAAAPRGWAEPVESGPNVLVSTGRGRIDAIDGDNIRKWRFPDYWDVQGDDNLDGIYGAPVVASDNDTTFIADYNGYVYAFKQSQAPTTAQYESDAPRPVAASINLGEPVIGGVALDTTTNDLFVTSGARLLRLRYQSSGLTSDWVFETGADIWSEPVLASGNRVIFTSLDGGLYALDRTTGAQVWKYNGGDSGLVSTPAIIGDTIYAGGFDSKLHAVDLASGTGKWTFDASYWVWNTPISDGNTIIFGDFNGVLYGVSSSDGSESWRVALGKGAIVGAPVLAQGTLVVATEDGWITGLVAATREVRWQKQIDTSITADLVVGTDGTVLIAPRGCVTPEGLEQKTYYYGVNPSNGELIQAREVC
jgi:outer membrane protein assembly factor BamB